MLERKFFAFSQTLDQAWVDMNTDGLSTALGTQTP